MEATVMVADTAQRSGTKGDRQWTMTKLIDGNGDEYPTFDGKLATQVLSLKGKRADITWEETDKGKKLISAVEHRAPAGGGEYQRELSPVAQRRVSILNTIGHAAAIVNAEARDSGEKLDVGERWRRVKILAVQMMDFSFELSEKDPGDVPFLESADDVPFAPELPDVG